MALIALLFLVAPLVELYVIVQVARSIGVLETIASLVLVGVAGAWLVKHQGLAVWRRFNETLARGQIPHAEIVDGVFVLGAGALLLAPGFVSDALALLLLLPPVRALLRGPLVGRFGVARVVTFGADRYNVHAGRHRRGGSGVWDAESWEADPDGGRGGPHPPDRGEIER